MWLVNGRITLPSTVLKLMESLGSRKRWMNFVSILDGLLGWMGMGHDLCWKLKGYLLEWDLGSK